MWARVYKQVTTTVATDTSHSASDSTLANPLSLTTQCSYNIHTMPQVQQNPPPAFAQQAVPPVFAQSGAAPQFVYSTDKVHSTSPYAEVPTAHYPGSNQIPAARSGWWHRLSRTFKILIVLLVVAILAGLGAGLGVGLSHKKSSGSTSTGRPRTCRSSRFSPRAPRPRRARVIFLA